MYPIDRQNSKLVLISHQLCEVVLEINDFKISLMEWNGKINDKRDILINIEVEDEATKSKDRSRIMFAGFIVRAIRKFLRKDVPFPGKLSRQFLSRKPVN